MNARELDRKDPLKKFSKDFHFPKVPAGKKPLYFVGNSLGLQPKSALSYVQQEFKDWAQYGVEGHFRAKHPWYPYHEFLTAATARIVGAKASEVVVMNTLSVNLHLMMVSFYRPTRERFKILIERHAFPSDRYAADSQARFHARYLGFDPVDAVIEADPADVVSTLEREGDQIALVMVGCVNYLTGETVPIADVVETGHRHGCMVGFDLAHGAGNLLLKLHDWNVDFATWCSYKYLNGGPGTLAGCFVHERHAKAFAKDRSLPRFEGWWGTDKKRRFKMSPTFEPMATAESWQLSNPPIFQMAALRASLELFDKATMPALRGKSVALTRFLEQELRTKLPEPLCTVATPSDPERRGCHLSLRLGGKLKGRAKSLVESLAKEGVYVDFREPDVVRVAPVPLYNSFGNVELFVERLAHHAKR